MLINSLLTEIPMYDSIESLAAERPRLRGCRVPSRGSARLNVSSETHIFHLSGCADEYSINRLTIIIDEFFIRYIHKNYINNNNLSRFSTVNYGICVYCIPTLRWLEMPQRPRQRNRPRRRKHKCIKN